eukprot:5409681-Pleurochrysis_carterae.AAC.2
MCELANRAMRRMEDSDVRRAAEGNLCPCAVHVSHEVTIRRNTVDASIGMGFLSTIWVGMGTSGEVVEMMSREGTHAASGANCCRMSAACEGCARVLCTYMTGSDTA